jgi:hypothetical protein
MTNLFNSKNNNINLYDNIQKSSSDSETFFAIAIKCYANDGSSLWTYSYQYIQLCVYVFVLKK